MSGRPVNSDRQNAIDLGLKTYTGATHVKCGNNLRYVAGGSCVHCARIIATEQRDARKFLQRQTELDRKSTDGLDAKARREADIDELM